MADNKKATSYRLSAKSYERLDELAAELEITRTAVIELALRRMAETELPPKNRIPISAGDKAQLAERRKAERAEVAGKVKQGLASYNQRPAK